MLDKIIDRIIQEDSATILDAMKLMDSINVKTLFVYADYKFISILTIGDIQRAIIQGVALTESISTVIDYNKKYANIDDDREAIIRKMTKMRAEVMPILDAEKSLVDVIFWNDIYTDKGDSIRDKIKLPVVIMAGGKGTRLKPLTNVIPKPLIPIGEKTILEEIMDQFEGIGCDRFYMSVNYKFDIMKFYLDQLDHRYNISFFKEDKPLGTIGSVSLLKGKITTPFFVSNCDIIIDQDYRDVYDYHKENQNDITIVTAVKSFKIPYGVIETGDNGIMVGLTEKPENTYMINTGVYLLQPELINEIPEGEFFHITHLMEKVRNRGGKVGCFPVSEKSWIDMGDWNEYLKLIR